MLGLNPIGFLIGSFTARFVIDKFGRRYTLLASMVPVVIGTVSFFVFCFLPTYDPLTRLSARGV